jgi:hypothetical protein
MMKLSVGLGLTLLAVVAWRLVSPDSAPPAPASHNGIGDVVTVHGDGWIACGATKAALDEIINWQVRHDAEETKQTMMATRSLPLFPGTQVKILDDEGFIIRKQKVRILVDTVNGATVGRVCWIDSEMLK